MPDSGASPELGVPSWAGGTHAIATWVHRPPGGRARGAVVIAPPFGRERLITYRALRYLAVALAQRGFVVVRFAWSGFGDSAPLDPSADAAAVWRGDLVAATRLARAASGRAIVDAVGLRVGAALVAAADADPGLRTRVLWEPVAGRVFLRRQAALLTLSTPHATPVAGGIETPSEFFTDAAADALGRLTDPRRHAEPLPSAWRIVREPDARAAAELYQAKPEQARVAPASVDRVIAEIPQTDAWLPLPDWHPVADAVLRDPATGADVLERFVSVGPHRLPGCLTTPLGAPTTATAALLQPALNEPKGGMTMWPQLARHLAARGVTTLRADRRTSGDGETGDAVADSIPTTAAAIADIGAAARFLNRDGGTEVVGIGLCLGAWTLARVARRGDISRLIGLNQRLWVGGLRQATAALENSTEADEPPTTAPEPDVAQATVSPVGADPAPISSSPLRSLRERMRGRLPLWLRDAIARTGALESVMRVVGPASRGTAIELYYNDWDAAHFHGTYGVQALAALRRRGRHVTMTVDPELEHSLLTEASRRRAVAVVDAALGLGAPATHIENPSQLGVLAGTARC